MKRTIPLLSFWVILASILINMSSCNLQDSARADLVKEAAEVTSRECPMDLGTGMLLQSITVEGDNLVVTYHAPAILYDNINIKDVMSDMNNIAMLVQGLPQRLYNKIAVANVGMKLVFVNKDNPANTKDVTITPEQIKESHDMDNKSSLLDMIAAQLANMDLPLQIDALTTLTEAKVVDNKVLYTYIVSDNAGFNISSKEVLTEYLRSNLASMPIFRSNVKQAIEEDIHYVYTYYTESGNKLFTIDIPATDLL